MSRSAVQADCSASSPCPTPTPTPTRAFLSLNVTLGDPNTQITVNGGAFLANEQMTLYWDTPNHVAGGANADRSGNFVTTVRPFAGDSPGSHKLCASVQPNPCANFTLVAAAASPSPSPSASPSPEASPSPTATASAAATPTSTPAGGTLNGFDVITRPPLVFLPIAGALAILFSLGYWVLSIVRRPPPLKIPATAVVHRSSRPDYSAGFGTPPPAPATAAPTSTAWDEISPAASRPASPAPPAEPEAAAEPEPEPPPDLPPVDWHVAPPDPTSGPDDPLDFPEPGD